MSRVPSLVGSPLLPSPPSLPPSMTPSTSFAFSFPVCLLCCFSLACLSVGRVQAWVLRSLQVSLSVSLTFPPPSPPTFLPPPPPPPCLFSSHAHFPRPPSGRSHCLGVSQKPDEQFNTYNFWRVDYFAPPPPAAGKDKEEK